MTLSLSLSLSLPPSLLPSLPPSLPPSPSLRRSEDTALFILKEIYNEPNAELIKP